LTTTNEILVEFTMSDEYKDKFELTDSIEQVRFTYIRIAQEDERTI